MAGEIQPYRPITAADKVDALDSIVDAVVPVFQDLGDRVADYPGFIASNEPRTGLGNAVRAVARANCRIWAGSNKAGYSPRVNAANSELCGPYLDSIGEKPDEGAIGPAFTGGQCAAVYLVTIQRTNDDGSPSPAPFVRRTLGPVKGARRVVLSEGNPPNYGLQIFSSGELSSSTGCGAVANTGAAWRQFGSGVGQNVRIVSVQPCGANNCGDPEITIRPPATVRPTTPQPPTFPIDLPGVGPTNVNITLNVDGDPTICIAALGVCETVKVGPQPQPGGEGGGGTPPLDPVVSPPIDAPPNGTGGGMDTGFGAPPPGRIWVGAYVELLGDLEPFGIIPRDLVGQAALPRVVGNASLNVEGGFSFPLRSTFTQIRSQWSEHVVPIVGLPVSGIRVKVNPALGYRVYPVSVLDPLVEST